MGCNKSSSKRDVYSNINSPHETRKKSQINTLPLPPKELTKEDQTKCNVSKREEIIEIRAEINEIETKITIE